MAGVLLAGGAVAQPAVSTAAKGIALGTGFVKDMDCSLAFYHEEFGMEVPALPESGARS